MILNLNAIAIASVLSGIAAVVSIAGTLGLFKKKWDFNNLLKNVSKDVMKEEVLNNLEENKEEEITQEPNINELPETGVPTPETPAPELPTPGTPVPGIPNIQDKTNENIETSIGNFDINSIFEKQKEWQKELWAREDAIRKETQEREDTAYQRAVEDARKAGINVNLMNLQPASSGGGITSGSGLNMDLYEGELKKYLTEWETMINNELKLETGEKDRLTNLVNQLISTIGMYFIFGKK